jgi:hypothetical protein
VDTNNSANIFQKLVPDLIPDLTQGNRSAYSLDLPTESSARNTGSGSAAPLIFGAGNDIIDFSNLAGGGNGKELFLLGKVTTQYWLA